MEFKVICLFFLFLINITFLKSFIFDETKTLSQNFEDNFGVTLDLTNAIVVNADAIRYYIKFNLDGIYFKIFEDLNKLEASNFKERFLIVTIFENFGAVKSKLNEISIGKLGGDFVTVTEYLPSNANEQSADNIPFCLENSLEIILDFHDSLEEAQDFFDCLTYLAIKIIEKSGVC